MTTVYLQQLGLICSLGSGAQQVRAALMQLRPEQGMTATDRYSPGRILHVGEVKQTLPDVSHLPVAYRTRNNAMALAALAQIRPAVEQAIARFGADRVAVVVGTSTSGLPEGEAARAQFERDQTWPEGFTYAQQELGNLAECLAIELGLTGIAHVISTACSSGAKALASGARLLKADLADAVIAGGCDVLGAFTVAGFSALESVSPEVCNPLSAHRKGINLGEGAALFLMSREPGPVSLAGWGETSDAHHMSAPDPSGQGAMRAMRAALDRAGVRPDQIDYLNLHGTATLHNDAMESIAVAEIFGQRVPVSSTKPLTGHALAAAGAIEAAFAWLTLVDNPQGALPSHVWDGHADPALPTLNVVRAGYCLGRAPKYVMSNSFAFGGSNAALLLEAERSLVMSDKAMAGNVLAMQDVPMDDLVPHRGDMSWLDCVLSADNETVVAQATIRTDDYFVRDGTMPVWCGVEYMAQAVAAWAGRRAQLKGEAVKIGFLLGTRRYDVNRQAFYVGDCLRIEARCELLADNGLGMFACRILVDGEVVASGNLSVFEPPDEAAFLNSSGESA